MPTKPAIFPLFHKLYPIPANPLHTSEVNPNKLENEVLGIMKKKVQACMEGNVKSTPEAVYKAIAFSTIEIDEVNQTTLKQGQCEEWYC